MKRFAALVALVLLTPLTVPACVEFSAPDHGTRVVQLDWTVVSSEDLCGPVRELEVRFAGAGQTQIHAVDCEDGRAVFASVPEAFDHITVIALGDDGVELDRTAQPMAPGAEVSLSVDILR